MNFRPDLAEAVMADPPRKTVTRRLVSTNPNSPWWSEKCAYRVGQEVAICPGRGKHQIGKARVVRVSRQPLHLVALPGEAEAEGFASTEAFCEAWMAINGDYDPMALVWRIGLEAIR